MFLRKHFVLLAQVVLWLSVAATAWGQASPPKPPTEAKDKETDFVTQLQAKLKQVDELRDLDDAAKAKLKGVYQQALDEMESVKRWAAKAAQFEAQVGRAPAEIEKTKAALAALPSQAVVAVPEGVSLSQIEKGISTREAELARWRTALAADDAEWKGRASRRAKIPEQITAAEKRLADINAELQVSATTGEKPSEDPARRFLLHAQRRVAEQEILCCQKELAAYEARTELLPLNRDLDARQVTLAEQEIKQRREFVNRRRQQEADEQMRRARWEATQAHPAVHRLVEVNAALAAQRKQLAERFVETTRRQEQVTQTLGLLKEQFKQLQAKVDATVQIYTANTIGLLLRDRRESLPDARVYRRDVAARRQTISEGQLALLQLQDSLSALDNLEAQTKAVVQELDATGKAENRAELEAAVYESLKTKRDYLNNLITDHNAYFDKLVDLANIEQQLIDETERCALYIDQRVLWIASTTPISLDNVKPTANAFWWLVGPEAWLDYSRTLVLDTKNNPFIAGLAVVVFLVWLGARPRMRAGIMDIGRRASRGNCCRYRLTVEALIWSVLISVGWPALVWYFGWRLTSAVDASAGCKALGYGLLETARVFFALELLRQICRVGGLGEAHFGWPAAALRLLRKNIRWFSPPGLLLMCGAVAMAWQENDGWDASLGRLCFVAALLCFSLSLHRVLRPSSAVFQAMVASRRGGWLERFRYIWYPFCALLPAALALLAVVGYHYTARQLVVRLILTAYVLVGGLVCRALMLRWTLVNQRKLAIEQARLRRSATQGEGAAANEGPCGSELPTPARAERDLATINNQTRRLVEYTLAVACSLAIWCAWIDVLPALDSVNVTLWQKTAAEVVADGHGGTKILQPGEYLKLSDLCLALIVLATTVIAAKNIPGLLEMAVLQHLPVDAGARYAVATVSRYLITVVGVLLCFSMMGVGWSKLQWLFAAMSLGLGFGLQEIFANFISGLIILFERPVRVGDVVTIGDVTGVVTRIRIRATTVTDGDRKELIIPNKEFITGRVLNWTLTDPVNRVVIKVGVAYGSDTELVTRILHRVAKDHRGVLGDPPPSVSFEAFDNSSLNFVLRCFLPNMDNRGTVIHELHMAIDRAFREAGIEIPFPQHDVHVRTLDVSQDLVKSTPTPGSRSAA